MVDKAVLEIEVFVVLRFTETEVVGIILGLTSAILSARSAELEFEAFEGRLRPQREEK